MIAFVTSIGEPTTALCIDSLKRFGFEVMLIQDERPLALKLQDIYGCADDDFIRVDADVIVTEAVRAAQKSQGALWVQYATYDLYNFKVGYGGAVQRISASVIPILQDNIGLYLRNNRPETSMHRLPIFDDRTKFINSPLIAGIHGFGQKDLDRVKATKDARNHDGYDWWLAERLQGFYK